MIGCPGKGSRGAAAIPAAKRSWMKVAENEGWGGWSDGFHGLDFGETRGDVLDMSAISFEAGFARSRSAAASTSLSDTMEGIYHECLERAGVGAIGHAILMGFAWYNSILLCRAAKSICVDIVEADFDKSGATPPRRRPDGTLRGVGHVIMSKVHPPEDNEEWIPSPALGPTVTSHGPDFCTYLPELLPPFMLGANGEAFARKCKEGAAINVGEEPSDVNERLTLEHALMTLLVAAHGRHGCNP